MPEIILSLIFIRAFCSNLSCVHLYTKEIEHNFSWVGSLLIVTTDINYLNTEEKGCLTIAPTPLWGEMSLASTEKKN